VLSRRLGRRYRLLSRSRPEYEAYLTWGGFDPNNPPDPLAILGVTEGIRQTDSLEVFPCPAPDAEGCYVAKFFLHGVRWMPAVAIERVDELRSGEPLALMLDVQNPHDRWAVAVRMPALRPARRQTAGRGRGRRAGLPTARGDPPGPPKWPRQRQS